MDAKYRFNPETMAYALIATGFVPGGPNDADPGVKVPTTFRSSTTTNYEVGVKGSAGEGRFTYDFDVFDVEWRDMHKAPTRSHQGAQLDVMRYRCSHEFECG